MSFILSEINELRIILTTITFPITVTYYNGKPFARLPTYFSLSWVSLFFLRTPQSVLSMVSVGTFCLFLSAAAAAAAAATGTVLATRECFTPPNLNGFQMKGKKCSHSPLSILTSPIRETRRAGFLPLVVGGVVVSPLTNCAFTTMFSSVVFGLPCFGSLHVSNNRNRIETLLSFTALDPLNHLSMRSSLFKRRQRRRRR